MSARASRPQSAGRRFWLGLLIVLGSVLLALGSLAVWLDHTLLDSDEYASTVAPLTSDHEVAEALSAFAVDEIVTETDATAQLETVLRRDLGPEAASFSGAVASSIETSAARVVDEVIESDEFATLWREANKEAHVVALAAIRGDENDILIQNDGRVELDLKPTLEKVAADVSSTAGVNISVPEGVGRVELFRDQDLATAQTAARVLDAPSWVLPALAVALFALSIWLSRDRPRTTMWVGAGVVLAALLTFAALRIGRDEVAEGVADRRLPASAVGSIWDTIVRNLEAQTWALFVAGIVVAGIGAVVGDSEWARAFRHTLSGGDAHGRPSAAQRFARERPGLAWFAGIAVAVLTLLVWPEPSFLLAGVVVLLLVAYLVAVELLRRESPGVPAA